MRYDYFHSVILEHERCIGCTYCLKTCPTEAIRVKNGKASIIAERCIDCGECIRVCPNHAKSAITDKLDIIKNYKYSVAITLPVLYGQFKHYFTPGMVLSALNSLGFDEAYDTSIGSEIFASIVKKVVEKHPAKPVISSACPAILRLIQIRFPELLKNILDIETPVEISARIIKREVSKKTGLSIDDIGMVLITPCTARVTSIKNPIGINHSYIDSAVSIKDIYGPLFKILSSGKVCPIETPALTKNSVLYSNIGGQLIPFNNKNVLCVDGIHNAISVLEEIEMGKLNDLQFIEISACPGGCLGGPMVIENRYVALSNLNKIAHNLSMSTPSESDIKEYIKMYEEGFIKLTEKIEPKEVTKLDSDINVSIKKMDLIQNIVNKLPGINCGICGSPTCHAFAEDAVKNGQSDAVCPVMNIMKASKNNEK